MDVDPSSLTPVEQYKILAGAITPRPIAFVSSCSPDGAVNLAPFSFFNGMGANPMVLVFSPVTPREGDKDTLRNVRPPAEGGIGEFVVNLAAEEYLPQMAACAEPLPHGESELEMVGLTPGACKVVRPPRVVESPVSFECRTLQIVQTNPGAHMSANLVIGEVVHVWLRDGIVDDAWHVDQEALHTLGRMGGPAYVRTRTRFDFVRGREALDQPLPWTREES
jgi:flavin reductase (DIM6/NTAB) family NADH-FMN oxidoreductase RutF